MTRAVTWLDNWVNRTLALARGDPGAKGRSPRRLAPTFLAISIALTGCGLRELAPPIEAGPATTAPSPHPTATRTSSPTVLPSATSTPAATPSSSPIPILFAGTETVPLDSLSTGEPFVGELSLLTEIVLPPSGFHDPAFIPGTSELIYKYGLSLRRFDLTSNQLVAEVSPPLESDLGTFVLAPTGDFAVIADGGDLVVVDLSTGKAIRRVKVSNSFIFGMAFVPSGKLLVTLDYSGELVVWNAATWEVRSRFQHPATSTNLQLESNPRLLPNESQIALEGEPGHVYVLDLDGNKVGDVYIGSRGELPLVGEPGGQMVLGQDRGFTVLDADGSPVGGIQLIFFDCKDHETPAIQLLVLDSEGEQIGCQYLLDNGRYQLPDEQGATLATAVIRARTVTFQRAPGGLLGKVRLGFPEYGGTLVEVLGRYDETVGRAYLDDGRYLSLLPGGGALGTFTGREFLCVDLDTSDASCSMPFDDLGWVFPVRSATIPDGYWLALDRDLRLRLFDFVRGREAFVSQALPDLEVKSLALSDDRAFIAMIVEKTDTANAFLQIWGYPKR